jgi:hypothetical protein
MKREIRAVDDARGILQVTTVDERWYARPGRDTDTGLPAYEFVPSVTWIAGHYPKGTGFYKWLAMHGWDESIAIRDAARDKGSKVHQACTELIDGKTVALTSEYVHPETGQREALTLEEYECLMAFREWWAEARPTTLLRDTVVWGDGYAGTLDWLGTMTVPGESAPSLWLIDFKTGQEVWPEYEIQASAYKHALLGDLPAAVSGAFMPEAVPFLRLGILQLGYRRNKYKRWKLTEVPDQYPLFLAAKVIWEKECDGEAPRQAEYPLELTLAHNPPPSPKVIKRKTKAAAGGATP